MRYLPNRGRKWFGRLLVISSLLLIFLLLLFRIWILSNAVEIACEISTLIAEKKVLEEENKKLMAEIAELKSPERISKIATTDLKMVRSPETEIIFIKR